MTCNGVENYLCRGKLFALKINVIFIDRFRGKFQIILFNSTFPFMILIIADFHALVEMYIFYGLGKELS
jgi:hypothetical protein